jgi:hypothetical protein
MVAEKRRKYRAEAKHGPFAYAGKPSPGKNPAKKQRCVLENPI